MLPDPLETRAFGPSIYRGARLPYHENPPTSKVNEIPDFKSTFLTLKISPLKLILRARKVDLKYIKINASLIKFTYPSVDKQTDT